MSEYKMPHPYVVVDCPPREFRVGDVVHAHGMRLLIDEPVKLSQAHPVDERGGCYWTDALVLNRDEVPDGSVPVSWTAERGRVEGEHRWALQGNDLALYRLTRPV